MGSIPLYKPVTERRSTSLEYEESRPGFWSYFWGVVMALGLAVAFGFGLVALYGALFPGTQY